VTIYPTGYPPIDLGDKCAVYETESVHIKPNRCVMVTLYENDDGLTARMELISEWDEELNNVIVPFTNVKEADLMASCDRFHEAAQLLLPPGAGYPGTDEYALRQTKLRGQVQHAALTGLSECLALRHEEKRT